MSRTRRAEDLVDYEGAIMRGQAPVIFRSERPMCLIRYAEALESEGVFGEVARRAWNNAAKDWTRFSSLEIATSQDETIRLGEKEAKDALAERCFADLDALQPGERKRIRDEKLKRLTPAQRDALSTPPERRTPEQVRAASFAEFSVYVRPSDVAQQIQGPKHKQAERLAEQIKQAQEMARAIESHRGYINYDYWRTRIAIEQEEDSLEARRLTYLGDQAYRDADTLNAKKYYDEAFIRWRKSIDRHPSILDDRLVCDDLGDMLRRYKRIVMQEFPKGFILQDLLDRVRARR